MDEVRGDSVFGTVVHIVGARQKRPNHPKRGCPFCVGGIEAPEAYEVKSFPNRWPAMADERCEVVLYTPQHDATFTSLGAVDARKVIDLWAQRTEVLGRREDVDYVLIFENRGAEVGATIDHPHGQIYAYDHVPQRQATRLAASWTPDTEPGDRLVGRWGQWQAVTPYASTFPVALELAPLDRIPDLPSLDDIGRDELARALTDTIGRLDALFDQPLPYMMWINQRPTVKDGYDDAWLSIEIVSPWRSAGLPRFIAAAEVASDEYFNPVVPEDIATRLRRPT